MIGQTVRNYYPDELQQVVTLLRCLDEGDKAIEGLPTAKGVKVYLGNRLPILADYGMGEPDVIGYAVDEVGGAWSFLPVGELSKD